MEPLVSSIQLTIELSLVHTPQPIYTDTLVPSHAMLYTYIAAAYTQSSCQLATSATPSRHGTWSHDLSASPELQYVQLSFEPLASQKQYISIQQTIRIVQSRHYQSLDKDNTYVLRYVLPYSANVSKVKSARP